MFYLFLVYKYTAVNGFPLAFSCSVQIGRWPAHYLITICYSRTFSPLRNSPHMVRSPATPISHDSLCLNDTIHEAAEPLRPEISFDHVWSETVTNNRDGVVGIGT